MLASEYAVPLIRGMQEGKDGRGYQMMSMAKHFVDYTLEGCPDSTSLPLLLLDCLYCVLHFSLFLLSLN